jgi:hypothetical protein
VRKLISKLVFKRGGVRPFDINGDGLVNLADLTAIFTGERSVEIKEMSFLEERARRIWSKSEYQFTLLSINIQKRERKARSLIHRLFIFSGDRKTKKILNKILSQFEDQELQSCRSQFSVLTNRLELLQTQASDIRTSMEMRPEADRGKYSRTYEKTLVKTREVQVQLNRGLLSFIDRMSEYGVCLSEEQAIVLLARVDAGDIIKMSSVFAVISAMIKQFSEAKQDTSESIATAKKYYGVYIGLLELQIAIQSEYIDQIEKIYLVGAARIEREAIALANDTKDILNSTSNGHDEIYAKNLNSQEFTISVTKIYRNALQANKANIIQARTVVQNLLRLAENTLGTVKVSADLFYLARQSEEVFKEVISLQTPELIPFENLELQREFKVVTARIRNNT